MPVSPDMAEQVAKELLAAFEQAETDMLQTVARRLQQGVDSDGWAEAKLAQTQALRRELSAVVSRLDQLAPGQAEEAIRRAYGIGQAAGGLDLQTTGRIASAFIGSGDASAIEALTGQMVGILSRVGPVALRASEDIYRSVIFDATRSVATGTNTRRQAAQRALNVFSDRGITGFVDGAGRHWDMASYTEMAVRTTSGRAAVAGHADKLADSGLDLVQVSDAPEECKICRQFEGRVASLRGRTQGYPTLDSFIAGGLFHPNCFPAETQVSSPSGIRAADTRWYQGDLVVIETASGNELSVTPNHPVLTPEGWVAAGDLQVGESVVRCDPDIERMDVMGPNDQDVAASIGEIFHALGESVFVAPVTVPAAAEQFHGDGGDSDVRVVLADRLLQYRPLSRRFEVVSDGSLLVGGVRLSALLPERTLHEVLARSLHAPDSFVSGTDLGGPLLCGHGRPLALLGLRPADLDASLDHPPGDRGLSDSEPFSDLALGHPRAVQLDQVVNIGWRQFAGHVYNLESGDGWYVAESFVVHNCRHSIGLFDRRLSTIPQRTADPEGDRLRQQQRYLERQVRTWKRREVTALSPAEAEKARAKVREWQGSLRSFVAEHDRKRLRYREQIGSAR